MISIGTTVDRFNDDIHYKGGIQLSENIGWAATITSWSSIPPDPAIVGENWRGIWLERLNRTPFLAQNWIEHARRDDYWKHGSVCENYAAIKAPVLVMGGQHDGYRNAMSHLVENMQAPVKGILGPWSHKYPNISTIEPSIDYLSEALRWWDYWLKDIDTGVSDDPAMRAYVMDSVRPDPSLNHRPGRWLSEQQWPSNRIARQVLALGNGSLGVSEAFSVSVGTNLACGSASGEFFPFGFGPGELPDDQTADDALSSCWDGPELDSDLTILGAPVLNARVSADAPHAQMIVRLCDLRPDGTSALISIGMLNLRHRDGFEEARDLKIGEPYDVEITLDQTAYRLPKGHKLRVAISTSYWPYCWPEGSVFSLEVTSGALLLPVHASPTVETSFDSPQPMEDRRYRILQHTEERKSRDVDPVTGKNCLCIYGDQGLIEDVETGLISGSCVSEHWHVDQNDPSTANVDIEWTRQMGRGDWMVRTEVSTKMQGCKEGFTFEQRLCAYEGDKLVFERTMKDSIARYQ